MNDFFMLSLVLLYMSLKDSLCLLEQLVYRSLYPACDIYLLRQELLFASSDYPQRLLMLGDSFSLF